MNIVKELRKFRGVLYFYFLGYVYRDLVPLSATSVRVFTLIALLLLVGGLGMLQHILLGAIVALMFGAGLSQLSVDINYLRISKFKDLLVSSPLNPLTYALGSALGMSIVTLLHVAPLLAIFIVLNELNIIQVISIIVILALIWVIGVLLGFLISLEVRSQIRLMAVTDLVYSMLVYIMPVYYPITVLPEHVRPLTLISPPVNAVQAVKLIVDGGVENALAHIAILMVMILALTIMVLYRSKWRE
jgi:ABC-type polysaccharide/polyol phosphate export permease